MKKKYVKPVVGILQIGNRMLLAGSADNAITSEGGGNGQTPPRAESTSGGEYSKYHYNAWETWDDYGWEE